MIVGLMHLLFRSCLFMGLMQLHIWSYMLTKSLKNSLCVVSVAYSSVVHVCPSCATQLHVTHSATCNIVLVCQDCPTRHPVAVSGMVNQP